MSMKNSHSKKAKLRGKQLTDAITAYVNGLKYDDSAKPQSINLTSVADHFGISRQAIYKRPGLPTLIERAREQKQRDSHRRANSGSSKGRKARIARIEDSVERYKAERDTYKSQRDQAVVLLARAVEFKKWLCTESGQGFEDMLTRTVKRRRSKTDSIFKKGPLKDWLEGLVDPKSPPEHS